MCCKTGTRPREKGSKKTFALGLFTGQLTGATDRFRFFAGAFFRRLFVMLTKLHLAENAFPLHLLLQRLERLLNVVIAHDDLNDGTLSLVLSKPLGQNKAGRRVSTLRPRWIA